MNRNKKAGWWLGVALAGGLASCQPAHASDLIPLGPSYHSVSELNTGQVFNNNTFGIGLETPLMGFGSRNLSLATGVYYNSYKKPLCSLNVTGNYFSSTKSPLVLGLCLDTRLTTVGAG